jgi:pimeloyl-ACP methyl ester carboxylesterase
VQSLSLTIQDGRSLSVYDGGDPGGAPLVFHHGTPSAGLPFEDHLRLAEELGVRLVSYDRAGYGHSTRNPGRSIADVAADIAAVADALGFERFATWGISGGGPHALACAALLPERVGAVATIASVAPFDADGLDFTAGMAEGNVVEFGLAQEGEAALRPVLEEQREGLARLDMDQMIEVFAPYCSPVDLAAVRGRLGAYTLACFRTGLAPGVDGWLDDSLAFVRPWGFDPAGIEAPVLVIQGRQDLMVPFAHGEWLAAHMQGAEPRLYEEEGHMTPFVSRARDLFSWLRERV